MSFSFRDSRVYCIFRRDIFKLILSYNLKKQQLLHLVNIPQNY